MSRAIRRANRIREEIPIIQVLADYGYRVHPHGGEREQQFSCDLHGDGQDQKPSARVYPTSDSFYCFACSVSRDAIRLTREKEGVGFWEACRRLEQRYGLPPLPWEPEDEPEPDFSKEVQATFKTRRTVEEELSRLETFLGALTQDRDLPLRDLLLGWEAVDRVAHLHQQEVLREVQAKNALVQVRHRLLERLRETG